MKTRISSDWVCVTVSQTSGMRSNDLIVGALYLRTRRAVIPKTLRAFHSRDYRILWPANFVAYASFWMQMTLLAWFVLELTDSAWLVALVGFFSMAPMFLLGILGGALADRVDRHRLLMITQAASLASILVMATLLQIDLASYWHAYPSVLIVGTAWALDMPSRRSLIHDMLGRSGVTNAIALDSAGMSSSLMLGPLLGGITINLLGVADGYIVIAALYFVSLTLLSHLHVAPLDRDGMVRIRLFRDLSTGLRYVAGHPFLRAMVLITIVMNLFLFSYANIVPVVARDALGVGPGLMGMLLAAPGLGSVVGAILIASTPTIAPHGQIFIAGSIISFISLMLFAVSDWYMASLVILVLLGLGTAGFGTMQASMAMLVARKEMRGKALGIISLAIGAGPFGALLIGATASLMGGGLALIINAGIGTICVIVIGLMLPSLTRPIDETTGS